MAGRHCLWEETLQSTLTWLDYSERDRRRALDVIDLFRETGTLDELGIGVVRDSYSDLLFPGTSTIQTRACYFLLLPWTFQRLERLRVPSAQMAERARREELNLNAVLAEGPDTDGVFGIQSKRALKRLPSEAYWGGLQTWGIRLFSGPIDAYFRSLDGFYQRLERYQRLRDDPDATRGEPANWHPHIPDPPSNFPYEASVALRRDDSRYLRDRIQARHPRTLLAALAGRAEPTDLRVGSMYELADLIDLPVQVREQLHHARLFALVMHGAALLYNRMLATAFGGDQGQKWAERFEARLADWSGEIDEVKDEVRNWELDGLWQHVRSTGRTVRFPTQAFVERWVAMVQKSGPRNATQSSGAERLIKEREYQLKRGRAKLHNRRHLELWGGSSGADRLEYRWPDTKAILSDIFDGLAREDEDAADA